MKSLKQILIMRYALLVIAVYLLVILPLHVIPDVREVWWILLAAFGGFLLMVIALSIWTQRTIVSGLGGIREATEGLAAGDLERRVAEPEIQEFLELATNFNVMGEQVRRRVEESASDRGKLEAVLNSVSAGVMVTDSESRIIMLNPAARNILGVTQEKADGRRIIEVFSSRELDVAVSKAALGESTDEEIELLYPRRMFMHVKANPVMGMDGRVIASVSTIEDITAIKRLNQVRQDFIANVSHELRTPVASIKALTDSLLAGAVDDAEKSRRFLNDLDHEAARLSRLIEDLLNLSKLEVRDAELVLEDIAAGELFAECVQAQSKLADEYGVAIEMETGDDDLVHADRRLLLTALNNLVANAIKYNRPGGKVILSGRRDEKWTILEVSDTGIGIPREDLQRIFERFYRVDRARSRETGGTGLGLSIVRHVVQRHGGDVEVASVEGEGSTFSLRLPR